MGPVNLLSELLCQASYDRAEDVAPRAARLEVAERLVRILDAAPFRAVQSILHRRAEPLGPQRRDHPLQRPARRPLVAVVELERDHAEAGTAHAARAEADLEGACKLVEPVRAHAGSEPHEPSQRCAGSVSTPSRLGPVDAADEHAAHGDIVVEHDDVRGAAGAQDADIIPSRRTRGTRRRRRDGLLE